MILLDTTVLVYSVGEDHPLAVPCNQLMAAVALGEVRATTTVGVLQEFAHVRARRHGRGDASVMAERFGGMLMPLASAVDEDLGRAMRIFRETARLGAHDAVLAAVAMSGRMPLVSADRAFAEVPGLHLLDPAEPGFLRAVGAG